jgi:hypothetical protein
MQDRKDDQDNCFDTNRLILILYILNILNILFSLFLGYN